LTYSPQSIILKKNFITEHLREEFMAEKVNFECVNCGNKVEHDTTESKIPECCGKPMQVEGIDACDLSTTAEHSRMDNLDEPCDDGRSGS
jgi:Zn finger protein HypA/HybF involved in hydrogenase expression